VFLRRARTETEQLDRACKKYETKVRDRLELSFLLCVGAAAAGVVGILLIVIGEYEGTNLRLRGIIAVGAMVVILAGAIAVRREARNIEKYDAPAGYDRWLKARSVSLTGLDDSRRRNDSYQREMMYKRAGQQLLNQQQKR
jgi:hypothetical protein